jgi:NodT family efflux transporter outer membrane factor (OMF) lipoprotein
LGFNMARVDPLPCPLPLKGEGNAWIIPAIACGLLLSGCALGPQYHPPAEPPSATGPFVSANTPAFAPAAPPEDWWRLYEDPVLDGLVQQALAQNEDLKVAAANLARARGVLEEARAQRFPTTEVLASATYGRAAASNVLSGPQGTRLRKGWVFDGTFDASYEVDLFGRVSRAIEAARADTEQVRAAEDVVRVAVAAETTRAYADACAYAAELDVAKSSLGVAQDLYDTTVRQRNLGARSDFDVASAGATLEQTRAAIPNLEGEWRAALFDLAVLTGQAPAEISKDAEACRVAPQLKQPLPTGDGAGLLARRPDVREAERGAAGDVARIGVAMAALFPSVHLNGTASQSGPNGKALTSSSGFAFAVGPLITWSFPNILAAEAGVTQARGQASASIAQFHSTVLNALKETEEALTAYDAELRTRAALSAARDDAQRAYQLAQVQLQNGAIGFPDLLQSERVYLEAQASLASADQLLVSDQITVFKSLGGGWSQAPAVNPEPVG